MALFRRRRPTESAPTVAVDEFWARWPELRGPLAASVDAGEAVPGDIAERLNESVTRIHPGLTWEVSPAPVESSADLSALDPSDDTDDVDTEELMARMAQMDDPLALLGEGAEGATPAAYALTLSGGADDDARVLAERWMRAAPAESGWRFFPAYPADHDKLSKSVNWDGHELDLAHCTMALRVDQGQGKVEVGVYHPDNMFLPEEAQAGVADHVVMLALGEDDYVRWVSRVEPLLERPLDPLPPASLPAVARQLAGAHGNWAKLQGRIPLRGVIEIELLHPLHRRDFPALTLYVQVSVSYANSDSDKLPAEPSASALEELANRLRTLLGDNGALLAQQTVGGSRQYHFYLDPDSGILPQLEAAVREWTEGKAAVQSRLDPQWNAIRQLRKALDRQLG